MFESPRRLSVVRPLQPLGVRACRSRWPARCWRRAQAPIDVADGRLDSRRDGGGAQRRDGVQPPRRCALRCAEPAHGEPRDAARGACRTREATLVRVVSSARVRVRGVAAEPDLLSAVAGRARHRVLVLAREALSPPGRSCFSAWRWRWRRSAAGWRSADAAAGSRGCSRLAIGTWVGGFDVLYACQDLEFDRAHGLRSIPVRFGVPTALAISRLMHVDRGRLSARARVGDAAAGVLFRRRRRSSRCCSSYEQSLVRADDLSQVKRAFDLNGYVGILYLLVLAVSIWRA